MIAANMPTREFDAAAPTEPMLDGFNHRLAVNEARRRLFGDGPGSWIGRYRVEARIGAGGMGEVYVAVDEELGRKVAIKRVLAGLISERRQMRLREEARALAKLSHANVVQVYEIGQSEGRTFLAMEYVAGQTLASWLDEAPRAWPDILARFCAAGRGLAAAHEAAVIHRDFKPDNVLLGDDGSVRVADFGIAVAGAEELDGVDMLDVLREQEEHGTTHYIAGTVRYMALEQLLGGTVDARSDQFSFCVALYEALWGQAPFIAGTVRERVAALAKGRPLAPGRTRIPARLWRIIRRGLARSRHDRWPDMASLLDALEAVPRRRRQALALGLATPLAAGLAIAGFMAWPTPEREIVEVPVAAPEPGPAPTSAAAVVDEPAVELATGPGRARPGTGTRIWITPDELRFAASASEPSRALTTLDGGRLPPRVLEHGHLIRPLHDVLASDGEQPPNEHDPITLFIDRRVPWATIVDVLFSLGRAGHVRYDFAVASQGEVRVVPARPPMYAVTEQQLGHLAMLQLWVADDHLEVSAQLARPLDATAGTVVALDVGDGRCELPRARAAELAQLSAELCELSDTAIPVWIAGAEHQPWGTLVEVLGHAVPEGICDGGIVIASDTRPERCDAAVAPSSLAAMLERGDQPD